MKKLIVIAALALQGCAYVAAHQTGIVLFTVGAGAVTAGENALLGAWNLEGKAWDEIRHKEEK